MKRGVGATLATVVIFSLLLSSSMTAYVSSQEEADSYALAEGMSALYMKARLVSAASALNLLAATQNLASHPFHCGSSTSELASAATGLSATVHLDGLTATATVIGPASPKPDNLSLADPFDGGPPDQFGMEVRILVNGGIGEDLKFAKQEVHVLHLPFNPSKADLLCIDLGHSLQTTAGRYQLGGCNQTDFEASLIPVSEDFEGLASKEGLLVTVSFAAANQQSCATSASIRVEDPGISGPYSTFTWQVESEVQVSPEA